MSPDFIEVPKKHRKEMYRPEIHLRFRAPKIFKAKLKELAHKRHTSVSKILRAYLRYCLEHQENIEIPLSFEKEGYWCEWMKQ